jgi:hypothetical protein
MVAGDETWPDDILVQSGAVPLLVQLLLSTDIQDAKAGPDASGIVSPATHVREKVAATLRNICGGSLAAVEACVQAGIVPAAVTPWFFFLWFFVCVFCVFTLQVISLAHTLKTRSPN